MISPHGTEHPHGTHDIPHGTEHLPRYCTHIIQGDSDTICKICGNGSIKYIYFCIQSSDMKTSFLRNAVSGTSVSMCTYNLPALKSSFFSVFQLGKMSNVCDRFDYCIS